MYNPALGDANEFIKANERLMWMMVNRYMQYTKEWGVGVEDFYSAAQLGMVAAYQKFDPTAGFKFSTYATRCMQNELNRTLRGRYKRQQIVSIDANVNATYDEIPFIDMLVGTANIDDSAICVREFIESLDEREVTMLKLRMDGLKEKEIANIVGLSQPQTHRLLKQIGNKYLQGMAG